MPDTVTVPVEAQGDEVNMANPIDPLIDKLSDQNFADQQIVFRHAQNESSAGNDKVGELARNLFNQASYLVGAHAAQSLETSRLGLEILAQRSAGMQPQAAGGPAPVKPA